MALRWSVPAPSRGACDAHRHAPTVLLRLPPPPQLLQLQETGWVESHGERHGLFQVPCGQSCGSEELGGDPGTRGREWCGMIETRAGKFTLRLSEPYPMWATLLFEDKTLTG